MASDLPPVDSVAPPPPAISSTSEERTLALLCHLGGVIGSFVVPLIIWLVKKDQSKFLDDQGKEALNFQITMAIALLISFATIFIFIGAVLFPAVIVVNIVFCILGGLEANKGKLYRYPFTLRLIK